MDDEIKIGEEKILIESLGTKWIQKRELLRKELNMSGTNGLNKKQ
jgi:hypothetical protein